MREVKGGYDATLQWTIERAHYDTQKRFTLHNRMELDLRAVLELFPEVGQQQEIHHMEIDDQGLEVDVRGGSRMTLRRIK